MAQQQQQEAHSVRFTSEDKTGATVRKGDTVQSLGLIDRVETVKTGSGKKDRIVHFASGNTHRYRADEAVKVYVMHTSSMPDPAGDLTAQIEAAVEAEGGGDSKTAVEAASEAVDEGREGSTEEVTTQ